ncbi:MAG: CPBP family intramembrane metalloprotease [Planctomycetes bacterium]|nr:CPBP family intramembrane metalloprotease [Planctomycetota bacterium]
MSWSTVKLIFHRELRDQLRDRRTLFMMLVMPILLYPGIGIGMLQFTVLFAEQPRHVIVSGREYLPENPPLIVGDTFVPDLFDVPEEAEQLKIVPDEDAEAQLAAGKVQVILVVPPDIQQQVRSGEFFTWQPMYNSADEKSRIAYLRLKEALDNWKRLIIRERISEQSLPPNFANPFGIEPKDIATPQEVASGLLWAKLFPFLLVIMSLTGSFYPAVDLCAGEKERGTMETLLISPAGRSEIVLGKYLTICVFSVGTAVLNLLSMALTGWAIARQLAHTSPARAGVPPLAPPGMMSAIWMLALLVPLAAFFSALGLALAAFARSTKEGQYYLTPLFLVTLPLVLLTVAPGVELNAFYSLVPVTGVALLLKALLQGQYDLAIEFMFPVLLPTVIYAVLALRWAIDQFSREDVLFREAERLDLWLRARRLVSERRQFPTAGEAMFCYAVMLLLVWFLTGFLTPPGDVAGAERRTAMQRSLIVMQIAFVAAPPLIMTVMLTTRPRDTLLIRRPVWTLLGLAVLLAIVLHPITVEASHQLQRGFPAQPKWVEEQINQVLGGDQPLWWQLFLIGLLPAVCEELAFRGFILSGLLRRMSVPTAVILSGFLFGFFHMNPQQLLNATALGMILGVLATRSGSLLPGICFHFANNALALLLGNLHGYMKQAAPETSGGWLFDVLYRQRSESAIAYQVSVLLLCALAATVLLTWLLKQPVRSPGVQDECADPSLTDWLATPEPSHQRP